jgi:hypothetical protein
MSVRRDSIGDSKLSAVLLVRAPFKFEKEKAFRGGVLVVLDASLMSSVFCSPLLPHPSLYGVSSSHVSSRPPCFPSVPQRSKHNLPKRFQSRVVNSGACVCPRVCGLLAPPPRRGAPAAGTPSASTKEFPFTRRQGVCPQVLCLLLCPVFPPPLLAKAGRCLARHGRCLARACRCLARDGRCLARDWPVSGPRWSASWPRLVGVSPEMVCVWPEMSPRVPRPA